MAFNLVFFLFSNQLGYRFTLIYQVLLTFTRFYLVLLVLYRLGQRFS